MNELDITISDLNDISEILDNNGYGGWCKTLDKAVELLKEQKPSVYERYELLPFESKHCVVWFEAKGSNEIRPALIMTIREPYFARFLIVTNGIEEQFSWTMDFYKKKWRCWTAEPTEAQIKAELWEDGDQE